MSLAAGVARAILSQKPPPPLWPAIASNILPTLLPATVFSGGSSSFSSGGSSKTASRKGCCKGFAPALPTVFPALDKSVNLSKLAALLGTVRSAFGASLADFDLLQPPRPATNNRAMVQGTCFKGTAVSFLAGAFGSKGQCKSVPGPIVKHAAQINCGWGRLTAD